MPRQHTVQRQMDKPAEQRGHREDGQRKVVRELGVRLVHAVVVRLTEERDEDHAERVQPGHERAEQAHVVQVHVPAGIGLEQDLVLREESGRTRKRDQPQRTDQKHPEREGQITSEISHLEDVLLVVQRQDHRAGREEQQRLEEGMRHQVEDRRLVGAGTERQEHVADLAHRRIGEHALDVGLLQSDEARHQCGDAAHPAHRLERDRRDLEHHVRARDQVDTGGDHRRRVDQRGDRRRAGHRVRQPGLQRKLRRLAAGASENQQRRDRGDHRAVLPFHRHLRHQLLDVERAELREQDEQADRHECIADARDDEGLTRGIAVGGVLVPEADQQVRRQAHALPTEVQEHQVVAEHQEQHRSDEQVHVRQEAIVRIVAAHVPGREQVDERADAGDHAGHRQRQPIEPQRQPDVEIAHVHPLPQHLRVRAALGRTRQELVGTENVNEERASDGTHADERGRDFRQASAGESQRDETGERKSKDEEQEVEHRLIPSSAKRHRRPASRSDDTTATAAPIPRRPRRPRA